MAKACKEPTRGNLCEPEARSFMADGSWIFSTLLIPCALRGVVKGEAALCGIGFSDLVRTCMVKDLAKKGACA